MGDRLTSAGERLFGLARGVLGGIARLVPRARRDDWLAEWEGEVWHRLETTAPVTVLRALPALLGRLMGALPHAMLLRAANWRLDMLRHDLRDAWRACWKRPGFSLVVVGTLALGIGANTAMFTMVNGILLRPLPYERAEELVFGYGAFAGNQNAAISPPDFLDYRAQNRVLSSLAARTFAGDLVVRGGDAPPARAPGVAVTANYFATLGVTPLHGRDFRGDEEGDGSDATVALISYGLWQRRFGGDPAAIGRTLEVNGRPLEVVGVMPRLADPTVRSDVWVPLDLHVPGNARRFHYLRVLGRLAPGVSLGEAQAGLDVIAKQLEATYPENEGWRLRLLSLRDQVVGNVGRTLVLLLGAVGLVLLIGCANLANLLLSRSTARQGEIAIRTALGATRPRLVRQLLVESLLLSLVGGGVGLGLAAVAVRGLRLAAAGGLPRLGELTIDPMVLGFAALVSIGTGVVFGLAPALHVAPAERGVSLSSVGRTSGSRRGQRARDGLVVLQVAVSLVLAIGAGLLVKSLWSLQAVDPGFDDRRTVIADVLLPTARYPNFEAQRRFWRDATERLGAMPGVSAAAASRIVPLSGGGDTYYWIEGRDPGADGERRNADINNVTRDYFKALRIPLVAGRFFGDSEERGGPPTLVINRSMAERLFPGQSAVGQRLVVDFGDAYHAEIVGVVGDVLAYGPRTAPPDAIYLSSEQHPGFGMAYVTLIARAAPGAGGMGRAIQAVVEGLDRDLPVGAVRTMTEVVDATTAGDRLTAQLLTAFAGAALALAMLGLYGVLAYAVAQRSREIGIRIALGAPRGRLFRRMVGQGLGVLAVGIAIGLPAALLASRTIRGLLFQVGPTDPMVFGAVTLALLAAGLAACLVPARRATRVDPRVALQAEG